MKPSPAIRVSAGFVPSSSGPFGRSSAPRAPVPARNASPREMPILTPTLLIPRSPRPGRAVLGFGGRSATPRPAERVRYGSRTKSALRDRPTHYLRRTASGFVSDSSALPAGGPAAFEAPEAAAASKKLRQKQFFTAV